MKIDDIIRKCIEVPGISIKRSNFSAELLMKTKEGKGSMTFFPLFPGLTLAYIFVNSQAWAAPNIRKDSSIEKGPLLLNYCVTGRCELILNNENFVYVKDGEISLTERFARKQYVYPRRIYEGMEFFVDIDTLTAQSAWVRKEFDIDFRKIIDIFCPNGNTYISTVTPEVEEILTRLWSLFDVSIPFSISQMKVYALALFSLLQSLHDIPSSQACTFFTETQVDIAKRVEKIITSNLRQHHPAWELAARFSVSETSLKNYFRGVFGQNISVYLREVRMKKAAELLVTTRLSVAGVAEQVGYVNQSKFAAVFKKQFSLSPLEYRRSKNLENR
ncbi:AraC family transcriptional regulator [Lacrimispora sp. NSJ-141]|uniref:AraC family transcriptional regulator n=1 Tax=Lientehia hominis TaxID=2897778 RepID=A0AAP2RHC5_9FIRM|nr:AraC family transcriptional regulator [Lientehia hominis]MCD2491956.1 AraC family transcriptional regulator [Lientehia hominis]